MKKSTTHDSIDNKIFHFLFRERNIHLVYINLIANSIVEYDIPQIVLIINSFLKNNLKNGGEIIDGLLRCFNGTLGFSGVKLIELTAYTFTITRQAFPNDYVNVFSRLLLKGKKVKTKELRNNYYDYVRRLLLLPPDVKHWEVIGLLLMSFGKKCINDPVITESMTNLLRQYIHTFPNEKLAVFNFLVRNVQPSPDFFTVLLQENIINSKDINSVALTMVEEIYNANLVERRIERCQMKNLAKIHEFFERIAYQRPTLSPLRRTATALRRI